MTELEAQQAAISSFGPVRAVVRAHRRRTVTAGGAAMAAWKLAALLATTVGAGGLAGMGIFTYLLRSAPGGPGPVPTVLVVYAAMAAGGLVLLAARRLTGHGTPRRDPLSPGVTASCFLVASALLGIFGFCAAIRPGCAPGADRAVLVRVQLQQRTRARLRPWSRRRPRSDGAGRLRGHGGGRPGSAGRSPADPAPHPGPGSAVPGGDGELLPARIGAAGRAHREVHRERRGDAHRSGHHRVLDDPALGWLRLGRSPRIGCRRRRVPGGGRRLRSPGGTQAGPAQARIRCALPRPGSG